MNLFLFIYLYIHPSPVALPLWLNSEWYKQTMNKLQLNCHFFGKIDSIKEKKGIYHLGKMITFCFSTFNASFYQYRSTYLKSMIEFVSDLS